MKQISYIYRAYPTKEQINIINYNLGGCRYVHNSLRNVFIKILKNRENLPSKNDISNMVKDLINKHEFLSKCDRTALIITGYNLLRSFKNYATDEEKYNCPKYKHKKLKESYEFINYKGFCQIFQKYMLLSKIGKLRYSKYRQIGTNLNLSAVRITKYSNKIFYVNCIFDYEDYPVIKVLDKTNVIGLDFSLKNFYVDSNGESPEYPFEELNRLQLKIKRINKSLLKMVKGSNNYLRQKEKICLLNLKIDNIRKHYYNVIARNLVNKYDYVAVETLNMKEISKHNNAEGLSLGVSTMNIGYANFLKVLEYKLNNSGKELIKCDRALKSSQMCSLCGYINPIMKDYSIKEFACPKCKLTINRDKNAAINIKIYALKLLGGYKKTWKDIWHFFKKKTNI